MQKTTYGFDKSGNIPFIAIHTFEGGNDGQLLHFIDGNLRAAVPPEGWKDYAKEYPDAQDVIDSLLVKPTLDKAEEKADDSASPAVPDQPAQ